jgi:hypothetical protein
VESDLSLELANKFFLLFLHVRNIS